MGEFEGDAGVRVHGTWEHQVINMPGDTAGHGLENVQEHPLNSAFVEVVVRVVE